MIYIALAVLGLILTSIITSIILEPPQRRTPIKRHTRRHWSRK